MEPSGGTRRFLDRAGAEWRVHEVVRQAGSGARSAYLPALWQHGWLLFERGDERRRLAPVPDGWRERDEAGLAALLDAAVPARAPRGAPPEHHAGPERRTEPHPSRAGRIERPRGRRPRVLVIDDDEAARYLLRRALDDLDLEVIEAATGDEGVERAGGERPQLIVLDYRLPGITGAAVLDQLRRDPATASIPVLWYSLHERALALDPRARYAAGRIDKADFDPAATRAQVAALLAPADAGLAEPAEAADG